MRALLSCFFSAALGAVAATWFAGKQEAAAALARRLEARLQELEGQASPEGLDAPHGARRLGGIYVTGEPPTADRVAGWTGAGQACMAIPMVCGAAPTFFTGACNTVVGANSASKATVDLSSSSGCAQRFCPDCFTFYQSSHGDRVEVEAGRTIVVLKLTSCSTARWGTRNQMGTPPMQYAVREYLFVNHHPSKQVILTTDDSNFFDLEPKSHSIGYCGTASNNKISWFSLTGTPKAQNSAENNALGLLRQGEHLVTDIDAGIAATTSTLTDRTPSDTEIEAKNIVKSACMSIPMIFDTAAGATGTNGAWYQGTPASYEMVQPTMTFDLASIEAGPPAYPNGCAGGHCPSCFIFHAGTAAGAGVALTAANQVAGTKGHTACGTAAGGTCGSAVTPPTLTLQNCGTSKLAQEANSNVAVEPHIDRAMSATTQLLREFKFINFSETAVVITDNSVSPTPFTLPAGKAMTAYCASGNAAILNRLVFSNWHHAGSPLSVKAVQSDPPSVAGGPAAGAEDTSKSVTFKCTGDLSAGGVTGGTVSCDVAA